MPPQRAVSFLLGVVGAGPVVVLLLIAIVISAAQPLFYSSGNIQNLLVQSSVIALLGLGQLTVILTSGIDLSVGSILGLASVSGGLLSLGASLGGGLTILTMLLVGLGVGIINGVVYVKGRIPHPFIVTLAMLSLARGTGLAVSGGTVQIGMPQEILFSGQGFIGPVPAPALIVAAAAAVVHVFLSRTQWGRWIYAVGGNPQGARQVGIPINRVLISVYAISGLSAGAAAIIGSGRTASGDPSAGSMAELDAISAVIIGGASFFGGRGTVLNVLVGALTLGAIRNGLDLLNVNPFLQLIALGAVLLLAIELDVVRGRLEGRLRLMRVEALG